MSAIDAVEKCCKKCKAVKSTIEFYKQKQTGPNGEIWEYYDSFCIECRINYGSDRRRRIKVQAILYRGGECVGCGYNDINHPEVFDFHHIDPSKKDFSVGRQTKSFDSMKNELDKCDLLCANCHRIKHNQ